MDYTSICLLIFYLIFQFVTKSESRYIKKWKSYFSYENPLNWNLNRIPCDNDRIIFDENAIIYLNSSIRASEIILPKNGQIIFGDYASITLMNKIKTKNNLCDGKDIKLLAQRPEDWYNPFNWDSAVEGNIKNNYMDGGIPGWSPAPHSERIPCHDDTVYFPQNNFTFKVNIDVGYDISIRLLRIWNTEYRNTESFTKLLTSDTGKILFGRNPISNDFNIDSNSVCNDKTGCLCGNDVPEIFNKICAKVNERGCPPLECWDPVTQKGHCCDRCASLITFTYKVTNGFDLEIIQILIDSYMKKPNFQTAITHLHKSSDNEYQLIIFDSHERGVAHQMAKAIKKTIDDDIGATNLGFYAIQSINLQSSTQWISDSNNSGVIWIVVITLLILTISIAVTVAYIYKRRSFSAPFAFARFHGFESENRVELELGTTPHDALDPNESVPISSIPVVLSYEKESINFDNPVFSKYEQTESVESAQQHVSTEPTAPENPIFTL